jgi:hypothetical protein
MASNWEALLRITPVNGWQSPGTTGRRGVFLFADSETLDTGAQTKEYDAKLLGVRESPDSTFQITQYQPKGNIVFQPRVDDILPVLMAHFQSVVKSGTGTYTFGRIGFSPDFGSTGAGVFNIGSAITAGTGTNAYGINVDVFFGASLVSGTKANGIRFSSGIVNKLTFSQKYNEALSVTAECKFNDGSYVTFDTGFVPRSVYGSFSELQQFVDYLGTVTLAGYSYALDSIDINMNNASSDKGKLGKRGYDRFPFGKYVADGSFELELQDDLNSLKEGQTGSLSVNFFLGTDCRIQIDQSNITYKPSTPTVTGGDGYIKWTKPYRAYPPDGTNAPSTIITVFTGTTFGTGLFGF